MGAYADPPAMSDGGERARLQALEAYGLAETAPEADFDHFAAIAADLLGLPVSLVGLVGKDQLTVKGRAGLDIGTAPRDAAFCSHTILEDRVLSVPDLANDPRFAGNPLVQAGPRFRFYAGAPLISPLDGHRMGALCVIGYEPRPALLEREATVRAEIVYLNPRFEPSADLAHALGCTMTDTPLGSHVAADVMARTSVEGVFAAGDLVRPFYNATASAAEGVRAGAAAHQSLMIELPR